MGGTPSATVTRRIKSCLVCNSQSLFNHRRHLPDHRGGRRHQPGPDAGGHVPRHEHSGGGGGYILFRHAARADRNRHHQPLRALLTLGSGIDHIESRSLPGVSMIKVYFQPGTNADSAVTTISNLAMAQLRRLPPGTLPPVVLKFDASSLPVCLVTLKGEGLDETQLRDLAQFRCATRSPAFPAPAYRNRSAASTGKSWST